jgi:hypothetical protein
MVAQVSVMGGLTQNGTFSGTAEYVRAMKGCPIPATVWVRPTAGSVTVSYSTDDGTNYTAITALTAKSAYTEASMTLPVTHLKFAGDGATAAGTWGVC